MERKNKKKGKKEGREGGREGGREEGEKNQTNAVYRILKTRSCIYP
jgi:hypothetical protein